VVAVVCLPVVGSVGAVAQIPPEGTVEDDQGISERDTPVLVDVARSDVELPCASQWTTT